MESYIDDCYHRFNLNNKDYLDKRDLKLAVTALLGYCPSKIILRQLFPTEYAQLDDNTDDVLKVSLSSFRDVMTRRLQSVYDPVELRRRVFKSLDEDCTGYISYENFRNACVEASKNTMTEQESFEIFQALDTHNDQKIGYRAFEALFSK